MSQPKLLDLFCGAQGAGVGYAQAGFDVTGIDIDPHPAHPEITRVIEADALGVLLDADFLDQFAVIHASPPCQGYTTMSNRHLGLQTWGGTYVIENVPGARAELRDPFTLHGGMFGLRVNRPRLFESNAAIVVRKAAAPKNPLGVYGKLDGRRIWTRVDGSEQRAPKTLAEGQAAMGIDWMNWDDLREAIPPAYTEFIGAQLIEHLGRAAA